MNPLGVATAGSAAFVVLFYVCVPGKAVQIEHDLLTRARLALLRAGLPADGLDFDGRDAILAGPEGSIQVSWQAVRVVSQVEGVRAVGARQLDRGSVAPEPAVHPAVVQSLQSEVDAIALRGAEFEPDSVTLTPAGQQWLTEVAAVLKKYSQFPVEIQGYADYGGDPAVTMELSRRRAAAARIYLIVKGVTSTQLTVVSHGNSAAKPQPAGSQSRAERRTRVVIKAPR